jgi:hypothetical protein
MNYRKKRLRFLSLIPWLIAILLGSTSCLSARWVTHVPPFVAADLDSCRSTNNLGGVMRLAFILLDSLIETYVKEISRGCVVRCRFDISDWSAFWLTLENTDLRPCTAPGFDVGADADQGFTGQMKAELKRSQGAEIVSLYVADIGPDWKNVRANLDDFRPTGTNPPPATRQGVEELVFVFEAAKAGGKGVVYLDNIALE